jgi:hypothetical protein
MNGLALITSGNDSKETGLVFFFMVERCFRAR